MTHINAFQQKWEEKGGRTEKDEVEEEGRTSMLTHAKCKWKCTQSLERTQTGTWL